MSILDYLDLYKPHLSIIFISSPSPHDDVTTSPDDVTIPCDDVTTQCDDVTVVIILYTSLYSYFFPFNTTIFNHLTCMNSPFHLTMFVT